MITRVFKLNGFGFWVDGEGRWAVEWSHNSDPTHCGYASAEIAAKQRGLKLSEHGKNILWLEANGAMKPSTEAPKRPGDCDPQETDDLMWAAMCIWETLIEDEAKWKGYKSFRESNGSCEARDRVVALAKILVNENHWEIAQAHGFDAPYDFEFIPLWMDMFTDLADDICGMSINAHMSEPRTREIMAQLIGLNQNAHDFGRMVNQSINELKAGKVMHLTPTFLKDHLKTLARV
jgi:hypothetical protein